MPNLNLKIKRIKNGLSQTEVAKIIGVTNQTISEYERGNLKPSYANMKKLSELYHASVDELFFNGEVK